jgi:hypothetical protein
MNWRHFLHYEWLFAKRAPHHFMMLWLLFFIVLLVLFALHHHISAANHLGDILSIIIACQFFQSLMGIGFFYQKESLQHQWRSIWLHTHQTSLGFWFAKLLSYIIIMILPLALLLCLFLWLQHLMPLSLGHIAGIVMVITIMAIQHCLFHMIFALLQISTPQAGMMMILGLPFYFMTFMNAQSAVLLILQDAIIFSTPTLLAIGFLLCSLVMIPLLCHYILGYVLRISGTTGTGI